MKNLIVLVCFIASATAITSIYHESTACEGLDLTMKCPDGYHLNVLWAMFGRDDTISCVVPDKDYRTMCSSMDTAIMVQDKCNGKSSCAVSSTVGWFGEPPSCAGTNTALMLKVGYNCEQTVYEALMCEASGRLPISCPDNKLIATQDAFWGRQDTETCPSDTGITSTNCSAANAATIFNQLCDGLHQCEVSARPEFFGEPCEGNYKFLKLEYACAECKNDYNNGDDAQCEYWANIGECENNPNFMIPECRKACWRCEKEEPDCKNVADEDFCNENAANGECEANPAWMLPNCRKSCTGCGRKTECDNFYQNETDCSAWADAQECTNNAAFMLPMCTESCFNCDQEDGVKCENTWGSDSDCDFWASIGECEANPGFMISRCTASCIGCTKSTEMVCQNDYYRDEDCELWAGQGECENNPVWMYKNCWKSCIACTGNVQCSNVADDGDCEYWAVIGECDANPAYMMSNCYQACSRCKPLRLGDDCYNYHLNDTECDTFADEGECASNPSWMLTFCRRSCTFCDQRSVQLNLVGQPALPGEISEFTAENTFVLGETFPEDGRLTHFTSFFADIFPVNLQVWRPDGDDMSLVYEKEVTPEGKNFAQTILADECVEVKEGDRIGFTSGVLGSPIAYNFDLDYLFKATRFRRANTNDTFDEMALPFAFSYGASYDFEECNDAK